MTRFVPLSDFRPPRAPWSVRRRERIAAPPERVWRALTNAHELTEWWCDSADVNLEPGGAYHCEGATPIDRASSAAADAAASSRGEIVELTPGSRLRYRWAVGGVETIVLYELANFLEETELTVVQTADRAPAEWPAGAPDWWSVGLPSLRGYVETGSASLRLDYGAIDRGAPPLSLAVDVTTFPWVIWSKLTDPQELASWWGRDVAVNLETGGEFSLGIAPGPRAWIEIGEGGELSHDWYWSPEERAEISWRIAETELATRVELTDHGPWSPDARRAPRAVYWASVLLALKQKSERGVSPRDYQDADPI